MLDAFLEFYFPFNLFNCAILDNQFLTNLMTFNIDNFSKITTFIAYNFPLFFSFTNLTFPYAPLPRSPPCFLFFCISSKSSRHFFFPFYFLYYFFIGYNCYDVFSVLYSDMDDYSCGIFLEQSSLWPVSLI